MHYNQQILVICHLHEAVLQKYAARITHRPDLAQVTSSDWQQAIEHIKPKIIVFNKEIFNKDMMQIWRNCLLDEPPMSPDSLRQHFLMDEKAVAGVECQNAMTSLI